MKNVTFSCRQILRAIRAAYIALFLAACAGSAVAAPSFGNGFTVSGSNVTGSGTYSGTYFYDGTTAGYTVTIKPNAQLDNSGSSYDHLIQFDHGSVTNTGSLYGNNNSTSDAIYIGTTTGGTSTTDTITNSGYIYGSNSAVYVYNNVSGGASASTNASVSNSGYIKTDSSDSESAVGLFTSNENTTGAVSNNLSLTNASNGTISGYYAGAELGNYTYVVTGSVSSQISLTNSGYIYGQNNDGADYSYSGAYLYNEIYNVTGDVNSAITVNNSHTIEGSNYSVSGYNLAYTVSGNATNAISITNSGYMAGYNSSGVSFYNENEYVDGTAKNSIALTNTGSIYGFGKSGSGAYLANYDYYGNGDMANSITVSNAANSNIEGSGYGVYAYNYPYENDTTGSDANSIALTNAGYIGGTNGNSAGSDGAYLYNDSEYNYYLSKETNTISVKNTGSIYGNTGLYAENAANESGYYAASGANITQTIGITNSGSGYIGGSGGYGIYAENYTYYVSYDYTPGKITNTISIANSGSAYIYADSNAGIYAENYNEYDYGTTTNSITIANSSTYSGGKGGYQIYANDDDAIHAYNYNYENYGDVSNTISVTNSGSIYGDSNGIYAYNYNEYTYEGGNVSNTIAITNSGVGTTNSNYGIFAYTDGIYAYNYNYDNSGTTTNKITVLNSGSVYGYDYGIYAKNDTNSNYNSDVTSSIGIKNSGLVTAEYDTGIYAYNYLDGAGGSSTNSITIANTDSAQLNAYDDNAIYAENYNYSVDGSASNSIAITNTGSVYAYDDAVNALNYNDYTYGSSATNTFSLVNTGSLYGKYGSEAVYAENHNRHSYGSATNTASFYNGTTGSVYSYDDTAVELYNHNSNTYGGDATNTITAVNTGSIYGDGDGLYLYNHNYNTSGNSINTITAVNAGSIYAGDGDGIKAVSGDYATSGTSTSKISITNTATGTIYGSNSGIYVDNYAYNGTPTTSVVNAGAISGGSYGVYLNSDNASMLSLGGSIYGGNEAVYFNGVDSTMTIQGRTNVQGLMDGGSTGNNNTIKLIIAGMTPAEAAAANAQNGNSSGSFTAGGYTYQWQNFTGATIDAFALESRVDSGLTDVATKIDNNPLPPAFDAYYAAAATNPEAATNSLVGRQFDEAFATIAINSTTNLNELFGSRATDLRLGTSGLDTAGLNIMSGSMIASLGATENTLSRLLGTSSVLGGTTMSDSKAPLQLETADENRWGAWASGTVTIADESGSATSPNFNYTSGSPTIGADYRFDRHFVFGGLLNFTDTGANFSDGSRLNVQSGLIGAYGVYSNGPWYINGLVGTGYNSYHNQRVTLGGTNAISDPDGYQVVANLTGGYDFKLGDGWTVSPEGGVLYTHLMEGSFTERNAGAFNLAVSQQDVDSLRTKLGFRVIKDFSWDHIKFSQQLRAAWYHECLDDSRGVQTALPGAGGLGSFNVQTTQAQRDFAIVGAGLNATPDEWHNNVTFFVNYDAQVGQSDYIAHNINGGFRVGF